MQEFSQQSIATVLVVDDEPAIRQLICLTLTQGGYTVLEAHHAMHAFQLCQFHPEPIDLLLTDVLMPYMNGRQLVAYARPFRPQMHVLYISGWDAGVLMEGFHLGEEITFLQKPFTPPVLLEKVREVLGR